MVKLTQFLPVFPTDHKGTYKFTTYKKDEDLWVVEGCHTFELCTGPTEELVAFMLDQFLVAFLGE